MDSNDMKITSALFYILSSLQFFCIYKYIVFQPLQIFEGGMVIKLL